MRDFLGCLSAPFILPRIAITMVAGWVLCRIFDPSAFRRRTPGAQFDYVGRWSTGNVIGFRGMFGARVVGSNPRSVLLTIYFSRFQPIHRSEIIERRFRTSTECDEIPVARKYGDDWLFSYLEGDQLMWVEWPDDDSQQRSGSFLTLRPQSQGSWQITEINRAELG